MKYRLLKLTFPKNTFPWQYLRLTLGLTWLFQFLAIGLQNRLSEAVILPLTYFGSAMVFLVALGLLYRKHNLNYRHEYRQRIIDTRRIPLRWLAVIFLLEPLITAISAWIDTRLGGFGMRLEALTQLVSQPLLIVPTVFWWMLFGPLLEEPGWRGYALDGLQSRYNAITASLIVGSSWAVWHIPLTLLDGTWQAKHYPFGTSLFWFYLASLLLGSFFYTWVYNNTNRSILAVILFHFVTNAFGELFEISLRTDLIKFALFFLLLIAVIAAWGPKTLAGRKITFNA